MPIKFFPGKVVQEGDLTVSFMDSEGNSTNVYSIVYNLYYADPGPPITYVQIDPVDRTPANPFLGDYYASFMIPPGATLGNYQIRWTFQQNSSDPPAEIIQEFEVVSSDTQLVTYTTCEADLIRQLRIFLRDNNPDRNYHFRPPEHEGRIGNYNRVFGYVWEDEELKQYLLWGLYWWNSQPPNTSGICSLEAICNTHPYWITNILWAASVHALYALSINWMHDEFDYSIGGVSLSLEKSSKYQSARQEAEAMLDKATQAKKDTVRFIRGLKQHRYSQGVRSSFGPALGKGILSPRSFIGY
jgi:hypothetical protein